MKIELIALILLTHFIADFIVQTDWMAQNKSKSLWPLIVHVLTYSFCFAWTLSWQFILINALAHFSTDWGSSRLGSYFWQREKRRYFFMTLGLDQLLHYLVLFMTANELL